MKFIIMVAFLVLSISAYAFDKSDDDASCLKNQSSLECGRSQADFWESLTSMADKTSGLSETEQVAQIQQYGLLIGLRYSLPKVFDVVRDLAYIYDKQINDYTAFIVNVAGGGHHDADITCLQELYPVLLNFNSQMPEIYDIVINMAKINKVKSCELKGYMGNFAVTISNSPLPPFQPDSNK